jgi:hypothetical protein
MRDDAADPAGANDENLIHDDGGTRVERIRLNWQEIPSGNPLSLWEISDKFSVARRFHP